MALRMNKRLQKEFEAFQKNTHDMKAVLPQNNLTLWHVNFPGAKGTLYEGEQFTIQLRFGNDYVPSITISPSIHQKYCLWVTSQSTNTSTRTGSSVSPYSTTVHLSIFRVVASPHSHLHLPLSAKHAQQRQEKRKTLQRCRVCETRSGQRP